MSGAVVVEVCLDSVESAVAAEEGGADRIELCADLPRGGTTPSIGMIEEVRAACALPLHLLIRPRVGDFAYSPREHRVIEREIENAKLAHADGVVLGMLARDGSVDRARLRAAIERARPLRVTFNRAFDLAHDPRAALEDIIEAGTDILLTSGRRETAEEGQELLADLVRRANGRIAVMAGAGLTTMNAARILEATGVRALHVGSGVSREIRNGAPLFSSPRRVVTAEAVRSFRASLRA